MNPLVIAVESILLNVQRTIRWFRIKIVEVHRIVILITLN